MHRHVYTHKKSKAVEFMVVDALVEADPVLKISEKIYTAADFSRLDDGLLEVRAGFYFSIFSSRTQQWEHKVDKMKI